MPAATTTSSATCNATYPTCPPPPYSAASQTDPSSRSLDTAADSRVRIVDDHDRSGQAQKQSLPSLHEALGVEKSASYSSDAAHNSHTAPSPTSPTMSMLPPSAHVSSYAHPQTTYGSSSRLQHSHLHDHADRRRSDYAEQPSFASQSSPVMSTPQRGHAHYTYAEPRSAPEPASRPTASQGFSYGYAPYPTHLPQPAPSIASSSSIYQPSTNHPPPSHQPPGWPSDSGPAMAREQPRGETTYGDSVKRHLDMYDFELALNEVCSIDNAQTHWTDRLRRLLSTAR